MAYEQLIDELKSGFGLSRSQAAIELGKLKEKRATNALITALDDPNMAVRSNAAFALGELGSVEAVPIV